MPSEWEQSGDGDGGADGEPSHERERNFPAVADVLWQYTLDNDRGWRDMSRRDSEMHERKYQGGVAEFEYDVPYADGTIAFQYLVDLEAMTQQNRRTGKVRHLRRLIIPS